MPELSQKPGVFPVTSEGVVTIVAQERAVVLHTVALRLGVQRRHHVRGARRAAVG